MLLWIVSRHLFTYLFMHDVLYTVQCIASSLTKTCACTRCVDERPICTVGRQIEQNVLPIFCWCCCCRFKLCVSVCVRACVRTNESWSTGYFYFIASLNWKQKLIHHTHTRARVKQRKCTQTQAGVCKNHQITSVLDHIIIIMYNWTKWFSVYASARCNSVYHGWLIL